jgi:hypothetical protein
VAALRTVAGHIGRSLLAFAGLAVVTALAGKRSRLSQVDHKVIGGWLFAEGWLHLTEAALQGGRR